MFRNSANQAAIVSLLLASQTVVAEHRIYYPVPDAAGGWRAISDPAKIRRLAGIDIRRLDQAFEYAQRTSQHGGLLVVRHGWLVYERYYGKGHREATPDMYSVTKAVTSVACGVMLRDKHDDVPDGLDQKIFSRKYLPEAFPLSDPRKAEIKLGQLLAMTAGLTDSPAADAGSTRTRGPAVFAMMSSDVNALRGPLWTDPGAGYRYSTLSTHLASMVLRNVTGMELKDFIDERLAKPMQWGRWGFATRYEPGGLPHTPGGVGIAMHSTDALRFGYLLLHQGRWGKSQLVPREYVELCARPSPYNPYTPFSLQFEVNADGHVPGAPRDAFFKSGGGGFAVYVVPSLDLVIYKMASIIFSGYPVDNYNPELTGMPQTYKYDGSRDQWKPHPFDQFNDGPIEGDTGVRRILEMVIAAVVD
jgi:CubicO group peptidase (beta-lactamase class C family)